MPVAYLAITIKKANGQLSKFGSLCVSYKSTAPQEKDPKTRDPNLESDPNTNKRMESGW